MLPCLLSAIEYRPWFDRVLNFEASINSWAQWGEHADLYRNEAAVRVTPWNNLRAEVEFDLFSSNTYSYSPEALKVSGQYAFLNEAIGDPFALSSALTVMLPSSRAKREYTLFYPGSMNYELHVAAGKECFFDGGWNNIWNNRLWLDVAYGVANRQSPWWRMHSQVEWNLLEWGVASLYIKTLAGASTKQFEFGGVWSWVLEEGGTFSLTLRRVPIAHGIARCTGVVLEYSTPFAP